MGKALFNASVMAFAEHQAPVSIFRGRQSGQADQCQNTADVYLVDRRRWSGTGGTQHGACHCAGRQKIPFELHVFEEGDHGLSLGTQASAESRSQINADVAKWSALAEAWLEKRLALDLPALSHWELEAKADR